MATSRKGTARSPLTYPVAVSKVSIQNFMVVVVLEQAVEVSGR